MPEPSFPKDAAVGGSGSGGSGSSSGDDAGASGGGEAIGAARGAQAAKRKKIVTGAAIGIGSAAIVAALLYANRGRKQDR